ncbi:protein kinase D4 [Anguilla anguilla]|uniref:protein kinase D4 n=1 Tax=Anguilla anguilla TaxID=7936 RepID=UPI0015AAEE46|nr:protein kinase D4 [Anguilla anguilla]
MDHEPRRSKLEHRDSGISSFLSRMSVASSPPGSAGPRPPSAQHQGPTLIQLQVGLFREVVCVSSGQLDFHSVKKLASNIIERKAPDCTIVGFGEKILLFRHEPGTDHLLRLLSASDTLQDGDLVEVVLSGSASVTEMKLRPHALVVQSYRTPTFCHHCGEMLWGLVRQGLKCEGCGLDFHKRCALQLPSDCSRVRRRCGPSLSLFPTGRLRASSLSTQAGGSLEEISMSKPIPRSRPPSWTEHPVWLGVGQEGPRPQVPHTFHIHSYTKPTVCQHCHRLLKGLFRQGLQCTDCKFNCHRRCQPLVPNDCMIGRTTAKSEDNEVGSTQNMDTDTDEDLYLTSSSLLMDSKDDELPLTEESFAHSVGIGLQAAISPCFSSNIPLMRVVQSVRHSKHRASEVLKEGWLLHHTSTDTLRKRHYWILDRKSITLYQNENSTKYYKELPLSEVLQVRGAGQLSVATPPGSRAPSFELVTGALVYCVQAGEEGLAWETAVRQALMPVESAGRNRVDSGAQTEENPDISTVYQIFADEVLGSGQFGVVYGGTHRQSGRTVAVKVIDKTRFPTKQERQLRNEVAILQNLSHPGVVLLEGMFETPGHVFVVMEKLHGDMLEMIMSNENGRLPERNTRFLVTQILEALRYLHLKHIAHCDLKPENVLLASPDPFPQVKLCDFGFARIIGEKSFRRSVVGTPAYLAPEVISSHGYNRSLDMWAVGVVLYVSLSGTFPFNEEEDISQQITNASFMYPRQTWAHISLQAVSLISNLLQVSVRRRFSVGKALGHPWLQDFQLWCDLREFELRMGRCYLTHEGDEERWRRHAQERGLRFPAHLSWGPSGQ